MIPKQVPIRRIRGIPDALWRAAKVKAAIEGKTLSAWVTAAIQAALKAH